MSTVDEQISKKADEISWLCKTIEERLSVIVTRFVIGSVSLGEFCIRRHSGSVRLFCGDVLLIENGSLAQKEKFLSIAKQLCVNVSGLSKGRIGEMDTHITAGQDALEHLVNTGIR